MRTASHRVLAFGITGGIGSGKTDVCRIFASLGASVVYADDLAKKLMESNPLIRNRLIRLFGAETYLPDGSLNRKHLAKRIFTDPDARALIDSTVHPFVLDSIRTIIQTSRKQKHPGILMFEAALIFEASAQNLFDYILVVDAEEDIRLQRIIQRDAMSTAEAQARIKAQMPASGKRERADFLINNNGEKKALEERCRFLFRIFQMMAGGSAAEQRA